jgi:aminoglycoside 3-N-acetyltransferase I
MTAPPSTVVRRVSAGETELAREAFTLMAEVFEEEHSELSVGYLERLLARDDFWAFVALDGASVVGSLTAHTLFMTTSEASEVLIYDLAVRPDRQRRGVGRALVDAVREQARLGGLSAVFVPVDDEDEHALDFYRSIGGVPSPVTLFSW